MRDIEKSVKVVGGAWEKSPYYARAENSTHVFWASDTIFRRLFDRLDAAAVLELACGHGRHAEKVAPMTKRLVLMDIHTANLEACRQRLQAFRHVEYELNNGFDFRPVQDDSLTAIFCYDAMVHFSPDIVESYLRDARRVLAPGGMGLFHHSNYSAPLDRSYGQNPHARNHMTQELFVRYVLDAGLVVVESVVIDWGQVEKLDCVTLVIKMLP
jgi:ubiquinone/menaquinone biosynthesis C-methylase UbiE